MLFQELLPLRLHHAAWRIYCVISVLYIIYDARRQTYCTSSVCLVSFAVVVVIVCSSSSFSSSGGEIPIINKQTIMMMMLTTATANMKMKSFSALRTVFAAKSSSSMSTKSISIIRRSFTLHHHQRQRRPLTSSSSSSSLLRLVPHQCRRRFLDDVVILPNDHNNHNHNHHHHHRSLSSSSSSSKTCPHHQNDHNDRRHKSSITSSSSSSATATAGDASDVTDVQQPKLKEIPSLPLFGSMISSYSGITIDHTGGHLIRDLRKVYKDHGPFFTMGLPMLGSGIKGTIYVVSDPNIMARLLRQEATNPSGIIESEWPMIARLDKLNSSIIGFMKRGDEWRRVRSFIQKDLLAPTSAKSYLPGIMKGASKSSKKAKSFLETTPNNDIVRYLNFAAFDMFSHVLFGGDENENGNMSDEEYEQFCFAATNGISQIFSLMRQPIEKVAFETLGKTFGIETSKMKEFNTNMDIVDDIGKRRLLKFIEQSKSGKLTEDETNSYFNKLIQRQPTSNITQDEMIEIAILIFATAVDTTAGKTSWSILHLALDQDFQQRLYNQLKVAINEEGNRNNNNGQLTPDIIENMNDEIPLLGALVRESHRCTPAVFNDINKQISIPTEVHGITLPAGSVVTFDSNTKQMDPTIVENPMEFKPERWLKDAVERRKNTPAAIVDHPFYSGPFSQGARGCPGKRVAYLEIYAMLANLLLDWKIEGPTKDQIPHWSDVKGEVQTLVVPDFSLLPEIRFVPRN